MEAFVALKTTSEAFWAQRLNAPQVRIDVGMDSSNQHTGSAATLQALRETVVRLGVAADIGTVGCNGMCWAEPTVVAARAVAGGD